MEVGEAAKSADDELVRGNILDGKVERGGESGDAGLRDVTQELYSEVDVVWGDPTNIFQGGFVLQAGLKTGELGADGSGKRDGDEEAEVGHWDRNCGGVYSDVKWLIVVG